eukprot:1578419-Pyramimonas_sp.AAC.1
MLRQALHAAVEQLEREGITANFDPMQAHAIIAGKQQHPRGRRDAMQRHLRTAAPHAATTRSRRTG